jgi:hypothetical protein
LELAIVVCSNVYSFDGEEGNTMGVVVVALALMSKLPAVVGSGLRSEPCRDRIKWPFGVLLPTLAVLHIDNRLGCFPFGQHVAMLQRINGA